jgi:2-polyprenyl-3-methyl-5-hydroxy-6-metoxy-1,4-benzoquinol methylase
VDTQQEGIHYIRDTLGYKDVGVVDIAEGEDSALLEASWDYMVIADVLEHNDNPVLFLEQIHAKFKSNVSELILTVPNAFSSRNFTKSKKGVEPINSDHRYWFTPYTLCKVVTKAGFQIQTLTMCKHGTVKTRRFFNNYYLRKHPLLRNNIAMVAAFTG